MNLQLQIKTKDIHVLHDIIGDFDSFSGGQSVTTPGNATLTFTGTLEGAAASPVTLLFELTFGFGVETPLVAKWLNNILKEVSENLRIDDTDIELSERALTKLIQDKFEE